MKKLTKEQLAEINTLVKACSGYQGRVQELVEQYNEFHSSWEEAIQIVIAGYNEKVLKLREVYDAAANEAQEYFDEHSESWQESDKGQTYATWIEQLENVELEELEVDLPDAIDDPEYHDWDNVEAWLPPKSPWE